MVFQVSGILLPWPSNACFFWFSLSFFSFCGFPCFYFFVFSFSMPVFFVFLVFFCGLPFFVLFFLFQCLFFSFSLFFSFCSFPSFALFPFFPKDFRGSAERKILDFFGGILGFFCAIKISSSSPWRNLPPTWVTHMATRRPAHNTLIHMDFLYCFLKMHQVHVDRRVVGWSAGRHVDHLCGRQISPWPARKVTEKSKDWRVRVGSNPGVEGAPPPEIIQKFRLRKWPIVALFGRSMLGQFLAAPSSPGPSVYC